MAYLTLDELKKYLGIALAETQDDDLLLSLIKSAQGEIDTHCGRRFEGATFTRYYGPGSLSGVLLNLDADLLSVSALVNGDGATLAANDYLLWPRNTLPAWGLRLKSSKVWAFRDPDSEITVTGQWGYSTTPPEEVVQATRRLAGYMYRQKDAQVFDVTAQPNMGVITVPQGMPSDVKILLAPYRKRTL
jgi:hypothetical protein